MPWAFISLIPANIIGEMWIGVCVAVVIDLVPQELTASSVAVYFFIIQIICGNMNLLVTPLTKSLDLREAILLTFPGLYILSALLFVIPLVALWRTHKEKESYIDVLGTDDVVCQTEAQVETSPSIEGAKDTDNLAKPASPCTA